PLKSEVGPPWVRYRHLRDLAGVPPDALEARAALEDLLAAPEVRVLLADVASWPGTVLASHRSPSQTFHSLGFLAELLAGSGLGAGTAPKTATAAPEAPDSQGPGAAAGPNAAASIGAAVARIRERTGPDGIPRLPMTYPEHFGGPRVETWAWALCDAPILLRTRVRFGGASEPLVRKGIRSLVSLAEPFGWTCRVAPELGSFRGPGKKTEPCPFATLIMLELLAALREEAPENSEARNPAEGPEAATGIEALLDCWERSGERHPYMFFMGTDFRKLKAPGLWYDIIHVTDVLSRFPRARKDPRFRDMLSVLRAKARPDGTFVPESVYQPYKAWDFGQKKEASPWIALAVERILLRLN
ncbi:MAG TPA: hypothetical protein VLH39_06505, partial [Magnetospirillaceae bacterium]|nr:hypothetical protein [Magnetospirillaceae bacterium]